MITDPTMSRRFPRASVSEPCTLFDGAGQPRPGLILSAACEGLGVELESSEWVDGPALRLAFAPDDDGGELEVPLVLIWQRVERGRVQVGTTIALADAADPISIRYATWLLKRLRYERTQVIHAGAALARVNALSLGDLQRALDAQARYGGSLGKILRVMGLDRVAARLAELGHEELEDAGMDLTFPVELSQAVTIWARGRSAPH
jgi:hypothetical protein